MTAALADHATIIHQSMRPLIVNVDDVVAHFGESSAH